MTKKEIFVAAIAICTSLELGAEATSQFTELLEPKRGGAQFNLEDVTLHDEEGTTITHILDSVFNVWVPVFDEEGGENFYAKPDTELGWSRFSKAAEKSRKDREKVFKATEKATFSDVMAGAITPDEAKEVMVEAEAARKLIVIPEDLNVLELTVED